MKKIILLFSFLCLFLEGHLNAKWTSLNDIFPLRLLRGESSCRNDESKPDFKGDIHTLIEYKYLPKYKAEVCNAYRAANLTSPEEIKCSAVIQTIKNMKAYNSVLKMLRAYCADTQERGDSEIGGYKQVFYKNEITPQEAYSSEMDKLRRTKLGGNTDTPANIRVLRNKKNNKFFMGGVGQLPDQERINIIQSVSGNNQETPFLLSTGLDFSDTKNAFIRLAAKIKGKNALPNEEKTNLYLTLQSAAQSNPMPIITSFLISNAPEQRLGFSDPRSDKLNLFALAQIMEKKCPHLKIGGMPENALAAINLKGKPYRDFLKNVKTGLGQCPTHTRIALLPNSEEKKALSLTERIMLFQHAVEKETNIPQFASCKSGLDRTGAMMALRYATKKTFPTGHPKRFSEMDYREKKNFLFYFFDFAQKANLPASLLNRGSGLKWKSNVIIQDIMKYLVPKDERKTYEKKLEELIHPPL